MNTSDAGKKIILIVEDEPDIIQFYSTVLSDCFEIMNASSGESALEQVQRAEDIDLVILDYKLSDMSGIELLREIKKIKPSVPIIIVTAFGDEDVAVKAFRHGARDYIKKPFNSSDLLKRIDFYLSFKPPGEGSRKSVPFDGHDTETRLCYNTTSPSNIYKIQKAIKYINDNYMAKISLAVVAQKSCISKCHFSRIFKKVTGMTYRDYLNTCRIEKAEDMLKKGTMSITEAAFSAGYSDLRHFERIFKKLTGLTPSLYKTLPNEPKKQDKPH